LNKEGNESFMKKQQATTAAASLASAAFDVDRPANVCHSEHLLPWRRPKE